MQASWLPSPSTSNIIYSTSRSPSLSPVGTKKVQPVHETVREGCIQDTLLKKLNCFAAEELNTISLGPTQTSSNLNPREDKTPPTGQRTKVHCYTINSHGHKHRTSYIMKLVERVFHTPCRDPCQNLMAFPQSILHPPIHRVGYKSIRHFLSNHLDKKINKPTRKAIRKTCTSAKGQTTPHV